MEKTCSFFGHRKINITLKLLKKVYRLIEALIQNNYICFLFGGFGEFDDLCYKVVTKLKKKYPYLTRICVLTNEKLINTANTKKLLNNKYFESVKYFSLEYDWWYTQIYYRNCQIVKHSDFIIYYTKEDNDSGAYKCLKYAIKIKKPFLNLWQKN